MTPTPPVEPFKGVATVPPPASLLDAMTKQVKDAVATLPQGSRGALVSVATTAGVNLAVVSKVGTHTEVTAWVGKTWGQPVSSGAAVRVSW